MRCVSESTMNAGNMNSNSRRTAEELKISFIFYTQLLCGCVSMCVCVYRRSGWAHSVVYTHAFTRTLQGGAAIVLHLPLHFQTRWHHVQQANVYDIPKWNFCRKFQMEIQISLGDSLARMRPLSLCLSHSKSLSFARWCVADTIWCAEPFTQPSNYNGKTVKIIFSWRRRREMRTLFVIFFCEIYYTNAHTHTQAAIHVDYYYDCYFYCWHRRPKARKTNFRHSIIILCWLTRLTIFLSSSCRPRPRPHPFSRPPSPFLSGTLSFSSLVDVAVIVFVGITLSFVCRASLEFVAANKAATCAVSSIFAVFQSERKMRICKCGSTQQRLAHRRQDKRSLYSHTFTALCVCVCECARNVHRLNGIVPLNSQCVRWYYIFILLF